MTKSTLFFLLLLGCVLGALAATASDDEALPRIRPSIKQVIIDKNAAWSKERSSSDETPESCADFVLKKSDVRQFFEVARFSTFHEHVHDLEISRCYATGRLVLRDGQVAQWEIDRARLGVVWLPDGRSLHFFCGKCRSKAYWEACDIDCIHAP